MKLINTTTLELSEFYEPKIPEYAILSHTWGEEEVSYQEWCSKAFRSKAGYEKISKFCQICRNDGFQWAWADTCCIDKSSSAELSEAINSMYRWYLRRTCYAYLADVPTIDIGQNDSVFCHSRWFTRGWTLQELIAPRDVLFYSKDWIKIASKLKSVGAIGKITGITHSVLLNLVSLSNFSVAEKMCWASKRETTRVEDLAYCLLGLFDVNMPLLYGEGDKAFVRFQEEIMKITADHTLFAWTAPDVHISEGYKLDCGLLAPSPKYFAHSNRYVRIRRFISSSSAPFTMTNRGLEIQLRLFEEIDEDGYRLAIIDCANLDFGYAKVAIRLRRRENIEFLHDTVIEPDGEFVRTDCHKLEILGGSIASTRPQTVYSATEQVVHSQVLKIRQLVKGAFPNS